MCPSYRVTEDEQHVTRGRANTLRLALSGQLGPDALTSRRRWRATLDLCVACKACRRECPTGVDMARMKIEVMHQMRRHGGLPLRDRADRLSAALCAVRKPRALAAAPARPRAGRRRACPSGRSGSARGARCRAGTRRPYRPRPNGQPPGGDGRDVVLFADTFTTWFEPDNARAAVAVLEAAGYRVHAAQPPGRRPLCCGRTFLAAGLVEEARREARATLAALEPLRRARRAGGRPRAVLPAHHARRVRGAAAGRGDRRARRPGAAARGVPVARARRPADLTCRCARTAGGGRWCTATATRRRSARWTR